VTADDNTDTLTLKGIDITGATTAYSAVAGTGDTNTGRQSVDTAVNAKAALVKVQDAITQLSTDRAEIGASNSQLKFTSEQLTILNDNLQASNSRIKDVDVATESTNYARYNILVQAGTAMLAQANASTQSALRLLQ
jgi:flagellin